MSKARGQKLLGKAFEVFQRQPFRAEARLIRFLSVVKTELSVHQVDKEAFLFLEAVIAHADRILDHIVGPSFVLLGRNRQIAAQGDLYLLAAFQVSGLWGGNWHQKILSERS